MLRCSRTPQVLLISAVLACGQPEASSSSPPTGTDTGAAAAVASSSVGSSGIREDSPSFSQNWTASLGSAEIVVSRWSHEALAEVLGLGSYREPQRDSAMGYAPVMVRLWSVEREGPCVPHTHFVCQHDYLLTVVTGDLGAVPGLYSLGRVGEITDMRWVSVEEPSTLELTVSNYPPRSRTSAVDWQLQSRVVRLGVSEDSVWILK